MLTKKQVRNIQRYFAEQAKNENHPTQKSFQSNDGGKWCICYQAWNNQVTWYESDGKGYPVKYYDYLPE